MKKILTLFVCLLTLNIGFCQNIVIKYIGNTNKKIVLSYQTTGSEYEIASLSKDNRILNIKHDSTLIISSSEIQRFTKIFAEPNDTIEFYVDKKGLINYSSKNNPKRQSESKYINQSFQKFGPIENITNKKLFSIYAKKHGLSQDIDEEYTKEIEFLELSYKKNQISTSFYKYFKSIYWSLTIHNQLDKNPIKEDTFLAIEKSFDNADRLINIAEYRELVSDYFKKIPKNKSISIDLLSTMKFITTRFSNQTIVDYLLFRQINESKKNGIDQNSIAFFNEKCKNKVFLKEIYLDFSEISTPQILTDIIKKHKGNLILIDFWASWCVPCRKEMPFEIELINKYPNVSFIFISIDKSKSAWINASNQYPNILNKNNNFLIDKSSQDEIMKKINIQTIPRYVLFGKNGEIIDFDAPRPSSKEIEKLIDSHL